MGEKTIQLEKMFEDYFGKDLTAVAVSSCTAALHLSMVVIDVEKNIKKGEPILRSKLL